MLSFASDSTGFFCLFDWGFFVYNYIFCIELDMVTPASHLPDLLTVCWQTYSLLIIGGSQNEGCYQGLFDFFSMKE